MALQHCNTLQHTELTATRCITLQHTATRCITLQHAATHCTTLHHTATVVLELVIVRNFTGVLSRYIFRQVCVLCVCVIRGCNTLQYNATHCAIQCNTWQHTCNIYAPSATTQDARNRTLAVHERSDSLLLVLPCSELSITEITEFKYFGLSKPGREFI